MTAINAAREFYARGAITLAGFERLAEAALLHEAGPGQTVPSGWDPLPACDHEWVEVTGLGDSARKYLCARCAGAKLTFAGIEMP